LEPFESQKDVEVSAKVAFKKRVNNSWVYVNGDDGKPASETKTAAFRTGDRPKEILPEHVKYSYPIDRQYNFYADEHKQGYIHLTQSYAYLFSTDKPEGFDQKYASAPTAKKYRKYLLATRPTPPAATSGWKLAFRWSSSGWTKTKYTSWRYSTFRSKPTRTSKAAYRR
jgi:hypothetical protein